MVRRSNLLMNRFCERIEIKWVMLRNDLKGKFGHLRSENNIIKNYWYSRRRCLGSLDKIPSHDI